ncbi:His-Xaa-Ser repeat protein HxsA2 [Mycobacterium sp. 1465703.0]|uniref:His-Xaa-Ser repeat protein HxsA2 n=1 Tax=Mycobacterium sp. 1465703.0 TaxID=1834078 RepID=UPI0012EA5921|nr:His-Xaa-Ser repeat protein HxsA2 [Mycobacterium sp. 1465703.0]
MKILNLATALGALTSPLVGAEIVDSADVDEGQIARAASEKKAEIELPSTTDLMSFTVRQNSDGLMIPQHGSHVSHASHSSHSSHVSHASSAY